MFKITGKKELSGTVVLMEIEAPLIAKSAKSGQFVVIRLNDRGERFPLTIASADKAKGIITIVFQVVGKSTLQLSTLKVNDSIQDVLGPLGKATDLSGVKNAVVVGGGVGIAEIYPEVKELVHEGAKVRTIIGARTKSLLFFEDELKQAGSEVLVATDDGSHGRKGFVTEILKEILDADKTVDLVLAVGPVIMMKVVSNLTKPYGIKTLVSVNPIMLDATGMCGACRVTVGGKVKFGCVDGPSFDGHQVDFDELMKRLGQFKDLEGASKEKFIDSLKCEKCRE